LWWLQPVVITTNRYDFHPVVLAMPLRAILVIAARRQRIWTWARLILLILGWRDGPALMTVGLGHQQLLRRRWWLAGVGLGHSLGWLALLSGWLDPLHTARYPGVNAGASRYSYLGDSIGAIALGLLQHPQRILGNVDWAGAVVDLLLLALALLPFWRLASPWRRSAWWEPSMGWPASARGGCRGAGSTGRRPAGRSWRSPGSSSGPTWAGWPWFPRTAALSNW
jgi:hypothetical protein